VARPATNYWVDVIIAIGFAASAASGIVFLLPGPMPAGVLGLSLGAWSELHTWSSLVLVAGVAAHLALHWRWMLHMTRRQLSALAPAAAPGAADRMSRGLSRRSFLGLGAGGLLASGMLAASGALFVRLLASTDNGSGRSGGESGAPSVGATAAPAGSPAWTATPESAPEAEVAPTARSASPSIGSRDPSAAVACRHGVVNDPYPGQCRHYIDRDGDGMCDLSVPGSGAGSALGG
jgi:hypothetical protein